jgi:hypothetical protein
MYVGWMKQEVHRGISWGNVTDLKLEKEVVDNTKIISSIIFLA